MIHTIKLRIGMMRVCVKQMQNGNRHHLTVGYRFNRVIMLLKEISVKSRYLTVDV